MPSFVTSSGLFLPISPYPSSSFNTQKVLVFLNNDGVQKCRRSSETKTTLSYSAGLPRLHNGRSLKSCSVKEDHVPGNDLGETVKEHVGIQQKRAAKLHDFCLGIPFGGFVLCGGLGGFIFLNNSAALSTGVLFGGALLTLSSISLKVWRKGKSSIPFILGQAALTTALLWKNFQTYTLTKKLFPAGLYTVISAAMLCFYLYVVLSGGNPPSKKLKESAAVPS